MADTFLLKTFGCKTNQYDSQILRESLIQNGYKEVFEGTYPDVLLVNNCGVTRTSIRKAAKFIRKVLRQTGAGKTIVFGCLDADEAEAFTQNGVDAVRIGHDPAEILAAMGAAVSPSLCGPVIHDFEGHTRAFVKIQNGCDHFCTYCKIPYYRGRPWSRPQQNILDEVQELTREKQYRELVLTGTHIGMYGKDLDNGQTLNTLIRSLATAFSDCRFRLSSLDPLEAPQVIDSVLEMENICPHLHVALQSGSDRILERMERPYTSQRYLEIIQSILEKESKFSLTTDIIAGFPGETDKDVDASIRMVRECGFSKVHVFPFSARAGTKAAGMKDALSRKEKQARVSAVMEAAQESRAEYLKQLRGEDVTVLVEERIGLERVRGLCEYYIPVTVTGVFPCVGDIVRARVNSIEDGFLTGETV